MQEITIRMPDDWHCHLRDGVFLARTVSDQARQFKRSIVMPNLKPPVTSVVEANAYRQFILENLPNRYDFEPLMTLYLTTQITDKELFKAKDCGFIHAVKLYPQGATTHSQDGVATLESIYPALEIMEALGLVLSVHGEVTDCDVDIFDREAVFLQQGLAPILQRFPALKVVLEHISTQQAVDFVQSGPANLAATITPHHLLLNRNDLLSGGIKPHYYCLPIVKKQQDQQALIAAATSGDPRFFLGTDSAPHTLEQKESACGCAGIYSAHAAIELYCEVFMQQHAMDKLQAFASEFGAQFYGLPLNETQLTLRQQPWQVPDQLSFGDHQLIPLYAGQTLHWQRVLDE